MRMAFLPGMALLAGSVAWGQTASAPRTTPVQLTAQTGAPVFALQAQRGSTRTLTPKEQKALALQALDRAQAAALARTVRTERAQASLPEPIPTQWPHAKAEQIPTQWKARVVQVGQSPVRPAKQSAGTTAGVLAMPK